MEDGGVGRRVAEKILGRITQSAGITKDGSRRHWIQILNLYCIETSGGLLLTFG